MERAWPGQLIPPADPPILAELSAVATAPAPTQNEAMLNPNSSAAAGSTRQIADSAAIAPSAHQHAADTLPQTRLSRLVEPLVYKLGGIAAAGWVLLVLAILASVTMRHGLSASTVMMEEIQWHLYAIGIAFALSFSMVTDSHIRVDVMRAWLNKRTVVWIDIIGTVAMLIPYTLFVVYYGIDFAHESFIRDEISLSPGGLPYRWAIKSFLPLAFLLVGLVAVSNLSRHIAYLRSRES